jgi:hypothetical protein
MSDVRNPELERLFASDRPELEDSGFTERVMTETRRVKLRWLGGSVAVLAFVVLIASLVGAPLGSWAVLASRFFTTAIIDLGEGWWTLLLAPINTIGGLFVLGWKALRMAVRRRL